MRKFIVTLALLVSTTVFAERPSFALIESEQDVRRMVTSVENSIEKFHKTFDFYVGGTYNKTKGTGYPIIALKYNKYTLEFAKEGWVDAPSNNYWKFKVKQPFGIKRMKIELQQKKKQYNVKGFIRLF